MPCGLLVIEGVSSFKNQRSLTWLVALMPLTLFPFRFRRPASEKMSLQATSPDPIRFTSGSGEYEEKVVEWEISKVSAFFKKSEADLPNTGITFQAGQSVGINATCYFHFSFSKDDPVSLGAYLEIKRAGSRQTVDAYYTLTLSSGNETICFLELNEIRKFGSGGFSKWGWDKSTITKTSLLEKTRETDKLKVTLNLQIFRLEAFNPVPAGEGQEDHHYHVQEKHFHQETVNLDLGELLDSENGADLVIKIPSEGCAKMAHKAILVARSPVFARMLAADTNMLEGNTGEVVINDMSSKALEVILKFIYTGKVIHDWVRVPEEVLNSAEKYDLPQLKHFCGRNIMSAVNMKNAKKLYKLAKLLKLSFAASAIAEHISRHIEEFLEASEKSESNDVDGDDDPEE